MKTCTVNGKISEKLRSLLPENGAAFFVGKEEGAKALDGSLKGANSKEYFLDECLLNPFACALIKAVSEGRIGKVQSMDVNLNLTEEEMDGGIWSHSFLGGLLVGDKVIRRSVEESDKGYRHGFVTYEFFGGALLRILFTCAEGIKREYYHVYGSTGEIRADFVSNTATSYIQSPDYLGDPLPALENAEEYVRAELAKETGGAVCLPADAFAKMTTL